MKTAKSMSFHSLSALYAVLAAVHVVSVTYAFSVKISKPGSTNSVYDGLRTTPLIRAADQQSVRLTDLWRSNAPSGVEDELSVCVFLRHFGCFLSWEHAAALKEQLLPAVAQKGKLFLVGVGTGDAAAEFATQLKIDSSICFGDEGGSVGDAISLAKGVDTMENSPVIENIMSRNDQDTLKALGDAYRSAIETISFKKLNPTDLNDTMRQGGTFVFKGSKLLLEHYDQKLGDRCEIEDILKCIQ